MRSLFVFFILFTYTGTFLIAQSGKMTRQEYIDTYNEIAIKEMKRTGIPASITLAQGILESGDGNSTLAVKANNHFGIKCHGDWDGRTIHHDDDEKDECFRKYNSVKESYQDHSDFLITKNRYSSLFELKQDDYKGWARGLKKAGYATSHTYDKALIKLIEDNKLYKFDKTVLKDYRPESKLEVSGIDRNIKLRNGVKYINARVNDSFEQINADLGLFGWQLPKYNDVSENYDPGLGEVLYIQPKRNKAEVGNKYHIVKKGETMHEISQLYGIKLEALYNKNNIEPDEEPKVGETLNLRKRKEFIPQAKDVIENLKEEEVKDSSEMEFHFDLDE